MTDIIDELITHCSYDMGALEQLYILFKGDVIALTRSILRDKESTEDALQETFLRLRKISPKYKPKGKGKVYILKIASNIAHEIYRKNRKTNMLEDDIPNPVNEYVRAEAAITVDMLMRYLSQEERELIMLRFYSEMSLREAAEVIGRPVSTVQWRLESIYAKLKNYGIDIDVD